MSSLLAQPKADCSNVRMNTQQKREEGGVWFAQLCGRRAGVHCALDCRKLANLCANGLSEAPLESCTLQR
jgi:hypothetical protein